ncbi:MAG: response regulator transcription factor [Magnetospirillum sp.]|nr:response regulator transcription factor [Magnetospirillum sp.]
MPRILLVEDHPRMAETIRALLERNGIACDVVGRRDEAAAALADSSYDAMILDRTLPDGDGLEVLARLRAARASIPCMILTARDALGDRVDGLDAGADDYLTKPFDLEEMLARTRALLRRSQLWTPTEVTFGDMRVVPQSSSVFIANACMTLSQAELQIVLALARNEGRVVRRGTLEAAAWGLSNAVTPKALDVAIHRLRAKLLALRSKVSITNTKGIGYALAVSEDD